MISAGNMKVSAPLRMLKTAAAFSRSSGLSDLERFHLFQAGSV